MRPHLGRSSYLGDRAIGHPDPGAMAVAIWLGAVCEALFAAELAQSRGPHFLNLLGGMNMKKSQFDLVVIGTESAANTAANQCRAAGSISRIKCYELIVDSSSRCRKEGTLLTLSKRPATHF